MKTTTAILRTPARALCGAMLLVVLAGCSMVGLRRDIQEAKSLGLISGPVTTPGGSTENVYVALFRHTEEGPVLANVDRLTAVIRDRRTSVS